MQPPTEPGDSRAPARLVLLLVIGFIVYGSLYPFDFGKQSVVGMIDTWRTLTIDRPSRGDFVANLLLYMPFGMAIALCMPGRSTLVHLAAASSGAAVLSIVVETLQQLEPSRVSSLTDVVLNVGGSLAGCVWYVLYRRYVGRPALPEMTHDASALMPVALVTTWLVGRCAPLIPTIDLAKYRAALAPIHHWEGFSASGVMRHAVAWMVIAWAVRALVGTPEKARLLLLTLMAATASAQIVVVGRVLRPSELVGMAVATAMAILLPASTRRIHALMLAGLVSAAAVLEGLRPFVFAPAPVPFHWLPFHGSLAGNLELNLRVLMEKTFFAAALLWLFRSGGVRLSAAAAIGVVLWGSIETVQRWLPGRTAEITDPLLVLIMAVLLKFVADGQARGIPSGCTRSDARTTGAHQPFPHGVRPLTKRQGEPPLSNGR